MVFSEHTFKTNSNEAVYQVYTYKTKTRIKPIIYVFNKTNAT